MEQVQFLKRLALGELPVSPQTIAQGLQVFEAQRKGEAVLYAKTGGGDNIGWYVGIVKDGNALHTFAFNMEGPYQETAKQRIDHALRLLSQLNVY